MKPERPKGSFTPDEIQLATCLYCRVRRKSLCSGCSLTELREVSLLKERRTYAAGETISGLGETADFIGVIIEGTIAVRYSLLDGSERVVKFLTDGDLFGHVPDGDVPYSLRAETKLTVCAFEPPAFRNRFSSIPAVNSQIQEALLNEISVSREMIAWLSGPDSKQRLVLYLIHLCEHSPDYDGDDAGPVKITFPAIQGTIANYLGMTRWSMSREITWLRNKNILKTLGRRSLLVLRLDKLREIATSPRGENLG